MAKYKIALLPGDGTGTEVLDEGIKVVRAAAAKFGFSLDTERFDFGGERYMRTGETLPDSGVAEFRKFDAIFLGAIGHPDVKPGILEKGILLKARFELDQYINLRPVKLYPGVETPIKGKGPKDIDFVVVRENTQDLYTGMGGVMHEGTPNEVATQTAVYSRFGVDRALKYAFEYARKRSAARPWRGLGEKDLADGKTAQLTLCGKTNVLTYLYGLWERAFHEMGAQYPDVKREYAHVDATTMWFVKNPEWFDVIVTGNMFGDIITDLGAMIQGGMGIAAGGNINPEGVSMFEPIGGSAPKYTGMNVINPLACIFAGQMMLDHLGESAAANAIEAAGVKFLNSGLIKGLSVKEIQEAGLSTSKIGDIIADYVAQG